MGWSTPPGTGMGSSNPSLSLVGAPSGGAFPPRSSSHLNSRPNCKPDHPRVQRGVSSLRASGDGWASSRQIDRFVASGGAAGAVRRPELWRQNIHLKVRLGNRRGSRARGSVRSPLTIGRRRNKLHCQKSLRRTRRPAAEEVVGVGLGSQRGPSAQRQKFRKDLDRRGESGFSCGWRSSPRLDRVHRPARG